MGSSAIHKLKEDKTIYRQQKQKIRIRLCTLQGLDNIYEIKHFFKFSFSNNFKLVSPDFLSQRITGLHFAPR